MENTIYRPKELKLKDKYLDKIEECVKLLSTLDFAEEVILFGSCARSQCKLGSDVDLLVITDRETKRVERGLVYSELCYKLNGVDADIVFVTRQQYMEDDNKLFENIKRDGKILWHR